MTHLSVLDVSLSDETANECEELQSALQVAIVDDNKTDFRLLRHQLENSSKSQFIIRYYASLAEFLDESTPSPDAVILDRLLPETGLSECHILEIRTRHQNCGVIVHTGLMTASLRATAGHEGAIAVIEKGTLDSDAIQSLVETAAVMGPQIRLPGNNIKL